MGLNSFGELNLNESMGKTVFQMFLVPLEEGTGQP